MRFGCYVADAAVDAAARAVDGDAEATGPVLPQRTDCMRQQLISRPIRLMVTRPASPGQGHN